MDGYSIFSPLLSLVVMQSGSKTSPGKFRFVLSLEMMSQLKHSKFHKLSILLLLNEGKTYLFKISILISEDNVLYFHFDQPLKIGC